MRPPPRIDPDQKTGRSPSSGRRPRPWVVGVMAVLLLGLILVFVLLPRVVDTPVVEITDDPEPAVSTPMEPASPPAPPESTPTPAGDDGLRRALAKALDEGHAALEAREPEAAKAAFRRASILDPGNTTAEEGARRAEIMAEAQALEAEAVALEQRGERRAAEAAARRALELDPSSSTAREVRDRLTLRAAEDAYEDLVSRGLAALEASRYNEALEAFSAASKMRPGAPELSDGIARARAGQRRQTVSNHVAQAAEAERNERWAAAVESYRAALALEPTLAAARDGLQRSELRLELSRKITYHLENPSRLATADVLAEASDLANEARAVTPQGPRFAELITRLDTLVVEASTPIRVTLESDGLTDVLLYRVGELGTFDNHTVDLRPGTYTVVGRRKGYRDVRLTIRVAPGTPPSPVVIRCTDRI